MSKDIVFKLFQRIVVVKTTKKWRDGYEPEEERAEAAYVGDANDKNQLSTGLSWAGIGREEAPEVKYFDNDGFTLEIGSCPENSSQGSKLSFWMCKITSKDNYSFYTSINSRLLELLLKECTFINGVCQDKVVFVRNKSQLGVVKLNGIQYQQAVADEYMRTHPKEKRDDYKPGDVVETLRDKYVYIGYKYQYFYLNYNSWWDTDMVVNIYFYKKPKETYFFLYWSDFENKYSFYCSEYERAKPKLKYWVTGNTDVKPLDEYIKEYAENSRYKQDEVVDEIKELYSLQFQNNPDNNIDKEKVIEIVKAYYNKMRKWNKIFVNTYEV